MASPSTLTLRPSCEHPLQQPHSIPLLFKSTLVYLVLLSLVCSDGGQLEREAPLSARKPSKKGRKKRRRTSSDSEAEFDDDSDYQEGDDEGWAKRPAPPPQPRPQPRPQPQPQQPPPPPQRQQAAAEGSDDEYEEGRGKVRSQALGATLLFVSCV